MVRAGEELAIPQVPWANVKQRVNQFWEAREAPHHSIMGQTRSGKSYLTRHGILSLCYWDRVLIIDAKGNDPTLGGLGKPTRSMPTWFHSAKKLMENEERGGNWYRLLVERGWERAHGQVGEVLEAIYQQGDWVVVVDELRHLVDTRPPGIHLRDPWEELMMRGGSRGISMVNLSQEPKWLPSTFYTQASFVWVSRIEDESVQKRVAEVGSSRALLPHLQAIPKKRWIYMDNMEDLRFYANTMVDKSLTPSYRDKPEPMLGWIDNLFRRPTREELARKSTQHLLSRWFGKAS